MKTPHAILIGLSLIVAANFFKGVALTPANADGQPKGHVHFSCAASTIKKVDCFYLDRNLSIYRIKAVRHDDEGLSWEKVKSNFRAVRLVLSRWTETPAI